MKKGSIRIMKKGVQLTGQQNKKKGRFGSIIVIKLLVFLFFTAGNVKAQQTFVAVNDGDWGNPGTWDPEGVPEDRDVAIIGSFRTVNLNGNFTIEGLTLEGGTLDGNGELTITEFFNWNSGNLGGEVTEVGVQVNLSGQSESVWGGFVKNLNAQIDISEDATVRWLEGNITSRITGLGGIKNEGTFEANAATSANFIRFFNLPGAELVKSTSGNTIFSSGLFVNQGIVDLRAGTLDLRGSTTLSDPIDSGTYLTESGTELIFRSANRSFDETAAIESNSQVIFQSGNILIKGDYQSPNSRINGGTLEFDTGSIMVLPQLTIDGGTITGIDEIQLTGDSEWISGATLSNEGIIIDEGVTFTITGSGPKQLNTSLTNFGTIDWTDGNWSTSSAGLGTVFNNSPGQINIAGNGNMSFLDIRNFGTINRSISTGQASIISGFFQNENNGTVEVNSGTLRIGGSTTLDTPSDEGDYQIASGATLRFQQNRELSASSSISGDRLLIDVGNLTISGSLDVESVDVEGTSANLTLSGSSTFSIPVLNMDGNTLTSVVPLTVTDAMTWTRGTIEGPGTITIGSSGDLTISGTISRNLNGTIANNGITTWNNGRINSSTTGGGEFINNGEFRIESNEEFLRAIFTNNGLVRKTSSGQSEFRINQFVNSGDVDIEAGSIWLNTTNALPTPVDNGIYTLWEGTELLVDGSPRQLSPEGEIRGSGTITAANNNLIDNHGIHSPGNSTGIMTYEGEFSMDDSSAEIIMVLNGTIPGSRHDQLQITESADFNSGALTVALESGYSPLLGDSFEIIIYANHEGEFENIRLPELSDGLGFDVNFGDESLVLTVIDLFPNQPPVFTETFEEATVAEDGEFSFQFEAEDPDGDDLTFSLTEGDDVENASITSDGLFTFNPDFGQAGEYDFTVRVSDGELFDEHDFSVIVTATNQPPFFITTFDEATVAEDEEFAFQFEAEDPDGDELNFSLTQGNDVQNASITSDGLFSFNPDFGQAAEYEFTVRVSDGELFDEHDFSVTVTPTNRPPEFVSEPVTIVQVNQAYSYLAVAEDPDGDPITLTAEILPTWLTFTDNGDGTGLLEGTPSEGDVGDHEVELAADDGVLTASQAFTIEVREEPNQPPFFTETFDEATVAEDGEFSFQFEADDPDGDDLTFSLTQGNDVENASITSDGLFTFNPDFGQAGEYEFTVRVSDGELFDEHDFSVTVTDINRPPEVISPFPDTVLVVGGAAYQADPDTVFSDPDGDILTYTAESSDESVAAAAVDELLTVEPVSPGTAVITVTADDGRGGSVSDQFEVTVEPDEDFDPPVAENLEQVTWMNLSLAIDLSSVVSHPQNRPVSVIDAETPTEAGGAANIVDELLINYTPPEDFTGADSFTYTVRDDLNREASAEITIQINAILFELTDLGSLGGGASIATSLNDIGEVAGISLNSTDQVRPFIWNGEELEEPQIEGTGDIQAYAINDSGMLAGFAVVSPTEGSAYRYHNTETSFAPSVTGSYSTAYAINSSGVIAGVMESGNQFSGFAWDEELISILVPEGVLSIIYSLSDDNSIAGLVQDANGVTRGFRNDETGPEGSRIYDMNSAGLAVGSSNNSPMIWPQNSEPQVLAETGEFYSVNESGWMAGIVAVDQPAKAGTGFGLRFYEENSHYNLRNQTAHKSDGNGVSASLRVGSSLFILADLVQNIGEWQLIEAASVNRLGQIAGTARVNGQPRAFLLTPIENDGQQQQVSEHFEVPGDEAIYLYQNYPNPFNPSTTIRFYLAEPGMVSLTVYDLLGRRVTTLLDDRLENGSQTIEFDASALSSGVYIYRLQTQAGVRVRKLTLIK